MEQTFTESGRLKSKLITAKKLRRDDCSGGEQLSTCREERNREI